MKKTLLVLCLLVALAGGALWFSGRDRVQLDFAAPSPPPDEARETVSTSSSLVLSLVMTEVEMTTLVERELDLERYEDRNRVLDVPVGDARADLTLIRDGPLAVRLEGGAIAVDLPLSFASSVRWEGEVLGLRASFTQEPSGSLVATAHLVPRLEKDGTLLLRPSVSLIWTREPALEILGRPIAIGSLAGHFIEGEVEKRSQELEARIGEALQTRERLEELWARLHHPVELSSEPPLWLDVRPESLAIAPLVVEGGLLELRAGLEVALAVTTERPLAVAPVPLPDDMSHLPSQEGLDLHVPLLLSYEALKGSVEEGLRERTFDLGGGVDLAVDDFTLSGGGGWLFAALDVKGHRNSGGLEGMIYLRGRPVWDRAERTLSLSDFDYDERTTEGLTRLASWLLQDVLKKRIAETLVFPLADELDRQEAELARSLSRTSLGEGFVLLTELEGLAIDDVYASSEGLRVDVTLGGRAKIVRDEGLEVLSLDLPSADKP